jgi:hypothetical protein
MAPCVRTAWMRSQTAVGRSREHAGDHVRMSIEIFRGRMHHQVGAELSGRVKTGVATVESTASMASVAWAICAMPAMSLMVQSGLPGVSI